MKLHVKPCDVKATMSEKTNKRVQTKDIMNLGVGNILENNKLMAIA